MSQASDNFCSSIRDAEDLSEHFDALPKPPPANAEVLKRAALVMALTAWETYVEDRVVEAVRTRLRSLDGSAISKFVMAKLTDDLKRFHNPTADKTRRLFLEYVDVDVTTGWAWQHVDPTKAREGLNELLSKRGDAVHRSKPATTGAPTPHLVRRDELEKAIRFIKCLVAATDKALADN